MDPVVDLEAVTALCTQAIMPHVQGYIWQRDALQFTPSSKQLPPWASRKHKDKVKRDADADTKGEGRCNLHAKQQATSQVYVCRRARARGSDAWDACVHRPWAGPWFHSLKAHKRGPAPWQRACSAQDFPCARRAVSCATGCGYRGCTVPSHAQCKCSGFGEPMSQHYPASTSTQRPYTHPRIKLIVQRLAGAKLASRAPATSDTNTSSSTLADGPPCIWSVVRFGDNIEDEWFVTFLLMEVSRRVPHVSIQVRGV